MHDKYCANIYAPFQLKPACMKSWLPTSRWMLQTACQTACRNARTCTVSLGWIQTNRIITNMISSRCPTPVSKCCSNSSRSSSSKSTCAALVASSSPRVCMHENTSKSCRCQQGTETTKQIPFNAFVSNRHSTSRFTDQVDTCARV